MSERRTAEIKFRCTPTFKASLAAAADAADQSLTEYIEVAVESALRTKQTRALDIALLACDAFNAVQSKAQSAAVSTPKAECCAGHPINAGTVCDDCPAVTILTAHDWGTGSVYSGLQPADAPTQDVAPCGCRPWTYCPHKASA